MKLEEAGVKNVPVVSELTGFSWYDRNNPYTPINRPRVDISIEDDDVDQVPITESVDWFWGTRKDHFCIRKLPPEVKPKGRTQIGPSRGFPCMTPETDDDVPRCPHLDKCGLFRKDFEAANADILITNFHVYFNSSFRHPVAILESEGICHEAYLPNAAPVKRVIETGFDAVFVDEADATKSAVESKLVAKLSQRDASITAGILLDPKFIDAVSRFISDQTGDTDENARKRAKRRVERLTRVLLSLIHRVVTISADQETMGYNPGALHIDDRVRTWGELLPKEQLKAIAQPFTVNPSEEELEGVRIALASIDPHRMAIRRDLGRIQLSRLEAMAIAEGVRIFPEEMRKRLETVLYNFIVPLSSRFDFPLDRFGVDYYLSSPREGTERTLALVKSDPELTIRWHWTDVDAPRVWLLSATGNYRSASVTYIHWPRRMSHTAPRITAEHLQVIACKSTLSISGSNKDERYKLFRSMAEPLFDLVEKLTSNEENPGILVACPSYESVTALRDGFDDGYRDERRWRSLTSREGPLSIFLEDKAEKERLLSGLGERSPRILIAPIASIYRGHNWIDDEMNSLFNVIIMPTFNFQPPYTAEVVHVNRSRELMKLLDRWKSENRGSDSEPPLLRWRGKLMTFKEENELYRTYLVSNIVPALVQLIGRALRNENDRLSLVLLDSAGFENKRIQQLAERIEDAECPSPGLADAMKDEHLITVDLPEEAAEIILAHTLPKGKDSILKEVVS